MVVAAPDRIEQYIAQHRLELFKRLGEPELGDRDATGWLPCCLDICQEGGNPIGGLVKPRTTWVSGGSNIPATVRGAVLVRGVCTTWVERVRGVGHACGDASVWSKVELRGIGVMGEEVGCALDVCHLRCGEGAEEGRYIFFQRCWVVASQEDGIGEPAFIEVPGTLDSLGVGAGVGKRDLVASIVLEADLTIWHHGLAEPVGLRVSEEDALAAEVGLLLGRDGDVLEVSHRQWVIVTEDNCFATILAQDRNSRFAFVLTFINREPMLDPIAIGCKGNLGISNKVIDNVLTQPAPI